MDGLRRLIAEELQIGSQHALALGTSGGSPNPDLRDDLRGTHEARLIKNVIDSCKEFLVNGNMNGAAGHLRDAARLYCMHYGEEGQDAEHIFGNVRLADQVLHILRNIGDVMTRRKDVLGRLVKILEEASARINLGGPYHVHPSSYIAEGRESDRLYRKIIKFIVDHIAIKSNMTVGRSRMVASDAGRVPAFPVTLNSVPPYADYLAATGDDGSLTGGKPIIWEYSYNQIPQKLVFEVFPNVSEGEAGVDENGKFIIFKKDWNIDRDRARDGTLQPEDILDGMPKPDESLQIVAKTLALPEIMSHELTHLINVLRSGGVRYTAKGGDKQFDPSTPEYASSTEELQAYYTESASRLDRILDLPLVEIAKKWDMDYVYYLAIRDRRRFIRAFIHVLMERRHGDVWEKATESAKRRFAKRVYELYGQYAGSSKPGLRQMVKYLAGSKLQPPRKMRRSYDE